MKHPPALVRVRRPSRGLAVAFIGVLFLATSVFNHAGQPNNALKPSGVPGAAAAPMRLAADTQMIGGPVVSAVSRSANKLDVFGVDADQKIYTQAWEPRTTDGWWNGGQILGGVAAPGTAVYGVSRRTDYLDIFAVGTDRGVYTAAWQPGDISWRGWWRVGTLTVAPGTSVHAVSRDTDRIDLFAIGSNYGIYTTGWSPSTGWAAWTQINGGVAAANTTVYAVSRSRGKLDVFAVGADRRIYTAAWEPGAGWWGWWNINGGIAAPNTSVFAVSRSTDRLDVFAVGADQRIYTAAWAPGEAWWGWVTINGGVAAPNTSVLAVSRGTDKLDLFAIGTDQRIITAAWEPGLGWWGWASVNGGVAAAGSSVFPVSRSTDKLDLFAVGGDNGLWSAAWEPGDTAWRGWWQLRNGAAVGTSLVLNTEIRFNGGVPVGGWASLSVFRDGSYNFSGHFHVSGLPAYNVSIVWVLRTAAGTAFVFTDKGHVAGTCCSGSRDHDWNVSNVNPAIAAAWPDFQQGYSWRWEAAASLDIAGMWNSIKSQIGTVRDIIVVVGALA